jgi:hypothetical protein
MEATMGEGAGAKVPPATAKGKSPSLRTPSPHLTSGYLKRITFLPYLFLSGARPALSMAVALEAMLGCLQPIIGSKT